VVVGPDENANIRLACRGRLLTTTNVGTRVNARSFLPPPVVRIRPGSTDSAVGSAVKLLTDLFGPYRKTAAGQARGRKVLIRFADSVTGARAIEIFGRLEEAVATGDFCDPRLHGIGLLAVLKSGRERLVSAKSAVDLAAGCGLDAVTLDGRVRDAGGENGAGLLGLLSVGDLDQVLRHGRDRGVRVGPYATLDPQTTARHVWAGLSVVRNMGFELGKYGLAPLTLPEQKEIVARIQYWFPDWCAAPVCYVDYPVVDRDGVYYGASLGRGIEVWLDTVAKLGVRVVLIDTAEKSKGGRLLKDGPADERGYLSLDEVRALDLRGKSLGLKVLWAGGITVAQAYEFGRLGVFGIYLTSGATAPGPLDRHYRRDPALLVARVPQADAVARVKLLLEAGFLAARALGSSCEIDKNARALIGTLASANDPKRPGTEETLRASVEHAWSDWLGKRTSR
jgi:hypothetical protein